MTCVIILFAYFIQQKLIRKERAYRDIEKLLQKQELLSAYALIEGQDQERKRIAAEVHDNVGSLLATLKIYHDLVINQELDPETQRLSGKIDQIITQVTTEIRKISHSLDSGTLQQFGLKAAIEQLCEAIRNSGKITIDLVIDLHGVIDAEHALHIYRITQELFTNTLKHARATKIRYEITFVDGEISIIHEDNGVGFNHTQIREGMGLQNIRSRVSKLNGDLKIHSSHTGSTFIIEIPLT